MKMDSSSVAVYAGFLIPLAGFMIWFLVQKRRWHKEKPPQLEKLLRPPGHSLNLRMDTLEESIMNRLILIAAFGGLSACAAHLLAGMLGGNAAVPYWLTTLVLCLTFIAIWTYQMSQVFRGIETLRNIRLGLSGEQAVAEALHEAADAGYRIFHDLDTERIGNLDHIAIGARGVFLIETKARRRYPSRNGKPAHEVTYDGKGLEFPSHYDTATIPQTARNAEWLAQQLTKVTALPVAVQPVVALPGWYVQTKGNFPVKVMNATYLAKYLRTQSVLLDEKQVQRIIAWLDAKCRDVEF